MPRCPSCHRRLAAGVACPADGGEGVGVTAPPTAELPLVPGVVVDEWLGGGGQADVWALAGGAEVLKVARLGDAETRARLAAEAAALRKVGAPALVAEGTTADGRPFLRMARVAGTTLAEHLGRVAAATEVELVGRVLLAAAVRVHAAGVAHGDFKPENLVLHLGGAASLRPSPGEARRASPAAGGATWIDFGTAGGEGGSPEQLAPERWEGGAPPSFAADVYALGATLFELCTLKAPLSGDRALLAWAHRLWRPPRATGVPAAVAQVIARALAKPPAERFADARALAAAWDAAWRAGGAVETGRSPAAPRSGGRQPALLLYMEGVRAARVAALTGPGGGAALAREEPGSALLVFPAALGRDPAARALAAAEEVAALGGRASLRLAAVELRRRASGAWVAHGAALAAAWRPPGAWQGVQVDPALARLLGQAASPPGPPAALVGRDELLAAVRVRFARFRAGAPPALVVVAGVPGAGKTRVAEAIREQLADESAEVLVIDDAHEADAAAMAAAERAAGDEGRAKAFVVVIGDGAALDERHPDLGARVGEVVRLELGPLADAAARQLAAALLAPAEYVPEVVLARLATWAGGRPRELAWACDWLRQEGAIRRRPGGSWFVAAERLDELPPGAGAPWLAARTLGRLPDELAALLARAALVGPRRARLDAVAVALDGDAVPSADAGAGLELLARDGLLAPGLAEAVAALVPAAEAARVHAVALADARAAGDLAAVARHAGALGEAHAAEAAAAHLALARRADAACDDVAAERHAAAALAHGAGREALEARGRARWRLHRFAEGLADLRAAAAAAETPAARARTQLEIATALDWAGDFAAAEAEARAAAAAAPADAAPRVKLAEGRAAWRRGEAERAAELLGEAAALAAAAGPGEAETETVATLLAATALAAHGALADSEAAFDRALALTVARGDRLHRSVLHANRLFLWSARRRFDLAKADLRAAIALAREVGQPLPERVATYNLAELTYFEGDDPKAAAALARRAGHLAARFLDAPVPDDALLAARLALDAGDTAAARAQLAAARAAGLPAGGAAELHAALVDAVLAGAPPDEALVTEATRRLPGDEALDFHYWRARLGGAPLAGFDALFADWPLWHARFAAL